MRIEKNEKKASGTNPQKGSSSGDIIDVIHRDHKRIKELLKVLKDGDEKIEERKAAFIEFVPTLIAHAKPEEQTWYVYMKQKPELREDGFEGDVEHGLADQMIEDAKRTKDDDLWSAQVKVLAELVEHHIKEEEEEMLPKFRRISTPEERQQLAEQFLKIKIDYLAAGGENVIPDPKLKREEAGSIKH